MFSLPHNPTDLVGAKILLADGTPAAICAVYNLVADINEFDDFWVMDIKIPLANKECHYQPDIGISLTGRRSLPMSVIGQDCWLTALP